MVMSTFGLGQIFRKSIKQPDKGTQAVLDKYRLELNSETSLTSRRNFLSALMRLAKPYYITQKDHKEKALAWTLLVASLALTYYQVTEVSVGFNDWNRSMGDFIQQSFNAASGGEGALQKAWDGLNDNMITLATLTGKLLVAGYTNYKIGQYAILRWRRWMTEDYEKKYTDSKVFYHMQNKPDALDNPDQRIQEDPAKVADLAFELVTDAFNAVVTFVTFSAILWNLSQTQTIMGVEIPKFMFTAVMAYAALGTAITHYASKPLEKQLEDKQRFEANYRSDLKELHEKREPIALNNGEHVQKKSLRQSFDAIYQNDKKIINVNSYMLVLRVMYARAAGAVPLLVTFPQVVAGSMKMGGVFQVIGAFHEVKDAMSFYVNNATKIRAAKAYMNRLIDIDDALSTVQSEQAALRNRSRKPSQTVRGYRR